MKKYSTTATHAKAACQPAAVLGDSLLWAERLPGAALPAERLIDEGRRWWDLTHAFDADGRDAILPPGSAQHWCHDGAHSLALRPPGDQLG